MARKQPMGSLEKDAQLKVLEKKNQKWDFRFDSFSEHKSVRALPFFRFVDAIKLNATRFTILTFQDEFQRPLNLDLSPRQDSSIK